HLRGEEHGAERGHPRAECRGVLRALEFGERTLETACGRAGQSLTDETSLRRVARDEAVERSRGGVEVRSGIGRAQVERRGVHTELREIAAAGVHGAGGESLAGGVFHIRFHDTMLALFTNM